MAKQISLDSQREPFQQSMGNDPQNYILKKKLFSEVQPRPVVQLRRYLCCSIAHAAYHQIFTPLRSAGGHNWVLSGPSHTLAFILSALAWAIDSSFFLFIQISNDFLELR